jgi:hypothetical protein
LKPELAAPESRGIASDSELDNWLKWAERRADELDRHTRH